MKITSVVSGSEEATSPETESEPLLFTSINNPEQLNDEWCEEVANDTQDQLSSQETYDSCSEESKDNHDSGVPEDFIFINKPLHHGSTITYFTAILKYCLSNHLSQHYMDELLKLLQLLCVAPNHLPRSVYLLKNILKRSSIQQPKSLFKL